MSARAIRATTLVIAAAAATPGGCTSGRVLEGYPGYPFQTFTAAHPPDSVFYRLQALLADAGYPIDYTRMEDGLINTRVAESADPPLFLSAIVEPASPEPAAPGAARPGAARPWADTSEPASPGNPRDRAGTRVWIAMFRRTPAGPERVNPNHEELWMRLTDVSRQISEALGGTPPTGPQERAGSAQGASEPEGR